VKKTAAADRLAESFKTKTTKKDKPKPKPRPTINDTIRAKHYGTSAKEQMRRRTEDE
jgi:hypothetical protein